MLALFAFLAHAYAAPACITRAPEVAPRDVVPAGVPDRELLARLVYAEATSTGFPDDPLVHRGIAWGAMNRVRLSAASRAAATSYGTGVRGVIFKSGQFNPAVSARSPFAAAFLCPDDAARWSLADAAAAEAIGGMNNPFIQTDWEKSHGLSLVVNFYYPQSVQAKGTTAPWEGTMTWLGDVSTSGGVIQGARVRFYRLKAPPTDVPAPATTEDALRALGYIE